MNKSPLLRFAILFSVKKAASCGFFCWGRLLQRSNLLGILKGLFHIAHGVLRCAFDWATQSLGWLGSPKSTTLWLLRSPALASVLSALSIGSVSWLRGRWEGFARQFSHHRGSPRVLFALFQITRSAFDADIGRSRMAVTGLITLMRQTGLWFAVSAGKCLTVDGCIGWGLNPWSGVLSHQISQKISNAKAGTPKSQAMKYLPMMFLLKVVKSQSDE